VRPAFAFVIETIWTLDRVQLRKQKRSLDALRIQVILHVYFHGLFGTIDAGMITPRMKIIDQD
jgi:hypothetical protein